MKARSWLWEQRGKQSVAAQWAMCAVNTPRKSWQLPLLPYTHPCIPLCLLWVSRRSSSPVLSASAHTWNSNTVAVTAPCAWCCLTLGCCVGERCGWGTEPRAGLGALLQSPHQLPNKHVGGVKAWDSVASWVRESGKPPVSVHLSALETASSTSMLVDLHSFCSQEDCVIFVILFCLAFVVFFTTKSD